MTARAAALAAGLAAAVVVVPMTASAGPALASGRGPTPMAGVQHLPMAGVGHSPSAFEASIGLTRAQVEARFHDIDGSNTVFRSANDVKGIPRVLGRDQRLYTLVEVNGFPEVVDVQVVSILDTASKTTLENQVLYDSLVCAFLADRSAQNWCMGRVLNTNSHGLVTATGSANFAPVRITVKTYQSSKGSNPPVVTVNVAAI
jgi:tetrahydromethanopterin S-methyltransferase subunit F